MANAKSKGIALYSLESPYYLEGSPVIIMSGALVMDRFTENETLQLCLKNITDTNLVSCEVRIILRDARGYAYEHELYYKFDGLNIPRGKEFGKKYQIPLPDNLVRSFEVLVSEVTFGDYTRWENDAAYSPIDPIESLNVAFDSEEMARQYAVRYGSDCEYMPSETADLWYCTCGAVNHSTETRCYVCRRNRDALQNVNVKSLRRDSEARIQSERVVEEAEKREQEKKNHRRGVFLKVCLIILPLLIVAGLILSTVPSFLERRENYSAAESLLAEKKFDEARAAFEELGSYSDSAKRAEMDVPYEKALYVMSCAKNYDDSALRLLGLTREDVGTSDLSMFLYGKAYDILAALGNYRETQAKITEINEAVEAYNEQLRLDAYNSAKSLLDKKSYLKAREAFISMAGYRDSSDLAVECLYERALRILDFCESNNVRHVSLAVSQSADRKSVISLTDNALSTLGSDTLNNLKNIFYEDGVEIFYENEPGISEGSAGVEFLPICEAAAKEFEDLGSYKDCPSLAERAASAGDFTASFYSLLHSGKLDEAVVWLNTYDDYIPERDSVSEWASIYRTYCRDWSLYKGDSTVIPFSAGLADGTVLGSFTVSVCIEGDQAVLTIIPSDGDYTVKLSCAAGDTDFSSCPDGSNYYYLRINQVDHLIYMRYAENGTMLTSCEYNA